MSKISLYPRNTNPALSDYQLGNKAAATNTQTTLNSDLITLFFNNVPTGTLLPNGLLSGTGTTWTWPTWSSTLTNMTLGNGTIVTKYISVGKSILGIFSFTLGSTSAMGTNPQFSLPVTATSDYTNGVIIGSAWILNSGIAGYPTTLRTISTTAAQFEVMNTAGTYAQMTAISSTVPFTWTTNSNLSGTFVYQAA